VLHLEDSSEDAELVRHKLAVGGVSCDILLVNDKDGFEAALTREPFDLIISDYTLPGYDGVTALKRAQETQPDVPVILISGTVGEEEAVKCLHIGATDYLLKERLDRLVPAVQRALQEMETRRTRKRAEAALGRSETRKAAILDSVLDCIVTMDADGIVIEFNAAAERTFGYTKAEAIGRVLADLIIPPPLHDAHAAGLARYLATGEGPLIGKLIEITAVRSDGSEIPVELAITAIRYDKAPIFTGVLRDITARKQADETRARLAAIVDSSDDAIFSTTLDGTILTWNAGAERLYGYTAGEVIGLSRALLLPAGTSAELTAILEKAARGEAGEPFEAQRTRKDGSIIDISLTISPMTDPTGRVTGTSTIARDITSRKKAEVELRQRVQLSALAAAVGLSLADADSLARALQQCAEALVTHLGAAFARVWTLNEREGVLELQASAGLYTHLDGPHGRVPLGQFKIGRIARDRKPHLINTVIGDPQVSDQDWARREGMVAFAGHPLIVDGRVVGVMALFARHALSNAVISGMSSVADHIALGIERHRSADALRTAEERMRFALHSAGLGIWDMDYTTGVLRWSEILEAHYGLQPGTFGGTFEAFVERIHPDDRESVIETVEKAMKSGADFSVENRSLWPDGTVRWLSGAGRVQHGEHGEPVRAVGISLDVTERRALEEQFQQAQKMEAVGRLAGGVAHDFNNLLTVILGYCELLLADLDPDDPRQKEIAEIQRAGTSAVGLTRQLLAFSRKQIIEPSVLDLNVVVAEMRAMLGRLIREDVTVVLALRPALAPVKADRGQVEQIVLNLAVNARDAMPNGGTLTIETANVDLDEPYATTHFAVKPGPYIALTVTDTGTGMTPDVQAHLFEPFFTTKEVGRGSGIGLATVHGIVTRAGGSVGVSSEVGSGTSFKVYFPRADAAELVVETAAVARPRAGTGTVLVVEDVEGLRELAKRLLQRQGYTVVVAANADEALRRFEENAPIDVLLTDVVMPGGSGPELTRRLVERWPALKVIYMSGYTEEAIVQHGVLNPGIAFLHKPFTSETLGRKIRDVLDR
jgi:two-component system cell cycle sensor histidine kinase/response regulator CckA